MTRDAARTARLSVRMARVATVVALVGLVAASGAVSAARAAPAPPGIALASLGVVTIEANGALSDPSAPIAVSGSVYTLTGDLEGSLVDLDSGSTVDGGGYLLDYSASGGGGPDGAALTVNSTTGVTVMDLNASGGTVGVRANDTTGLTIETSRLLGTEASIVVTNASSTQVEDDLLQQGTGVWLYNTTGSTVEANNLRGNASGVLVEDAVAVTVDSNALANASGATGAAIRLLNVTGATIDANSAPNSSQGIQVNDSSVVTIEDNNVSEATSLSLGIGLTNVTDATVDNNRAYGDADALSATNSSEVTFSDNLANDSQSVGLGVSGSADVVAQGNDLQNASAGFASLVVDSLDVNLSQNDANGSSLGFGVEWSQYVSFDDDNASYAPGGGFDVATSDNVTLVGDQSNASTPGVEFEDSNGLRVVDVDAVGATYGVLLSACDDASVVGGNFSDTTYGVWEGTSANTTISDLLAEGAYAGVYIDRPVGPTEVTDSKLVHDRSVALYVYEGVGSVQVSESNLSGSEGDGVIDDDSLGAVTLAADTVADAADLDLFFDGTDGPTTVEEVNATSAGEYSFYGNDAGGPLLLVDSNFSGSPEGFSMLNSPGGPTDALVDDNLSGDGAVVIAGATFGGGLIGNDLLGVGYLQLTDDIFGTVYHNDFDTAGLDASGSTTFSGAWNAPYPVGGNYWTGYSGVDLYSGTGQNLPGSDGIGDTPFVDGSVTDAYPLMRPWIAASVSFTETGLPPGASWSVTFNNVTETAVAGTPLVFPQENGANTSYAYAVGSSPRYAPTPRAGSGTEDGSFRTIRVAFAPVLYDLTFQQTGIPRGEPWSVTVNGTLYTSTAMTLVVPELNGTYFYLVGAIPGLSVHPANGSVIVSGTPAPVPLAFSTYTFTVTFVPLGLPSGSSWSVAVDALTLSGSGGNRSFEGGNATYAFTVSVPGGYAVTPSSGSVVVNGSNITVYLEVRSSSATVPADLAYGLGGGLAAAGVLAAAGWAMALRRRPPRRPDATPAAVAGPPTTP
jgi:nitrous oxidase accessory protein NosD